MLLKDYKPQPRLDTKNSLVETPRFPVIDAHNHLSEEFGGGWINRPLAELLDILDQAHVSHFVDLDGGWGETILQTHIERLAAAEQRFSVFGGIDWSAWSEKGHDFGEWAANRLHQQASWGARGLKVWKPFGLQIKDPQGKRVAVDDPRLDPVWQTAGELNLPVMIHVADPVAFFDPLDAHNERWEELSAYPDWQFPSPPYPPFMQIMDELAGLVARHPKTTFIGAHVGCFAENLAWVGNLLDRCPNFYIDISARMGELGRQPYTARRFFIHYADRILFGTDSGPSLPSYQLYYRFLETDDEYFSYTPGRVVPSQGRWMVYGLFLPDDVLQKVYFGNATRILNFGAT